MSRGTFSSLRGNGVERVERVDVPALATAVVLVVMLGMISSIPLYGSLPLISLGTQLTSTLQELLGNLKDLPDSELTKTAKDIKELLTGGGEPETNELYGRVPKITTEQCKKDTCCVWKHMSDEMERLFRGRSGRCTKWARFAVRLGFHDSGAWQKDMSFGGADGSVAIFDEELKAPENKGLSEMIMKVRELYAKYHDQYGFEDVTHADIIQVAASVAVVVCPLGPRMRTFVGRPDGDQANPTHLLPSPFDTADNLINIFENKTIAPHGLTALIGAHTTSQQMNTSPPEQKGFPQDSTPGVWDVLFYKQTLRKQVPRKIFRFPSDERIAVHPKTRDEFREFAGKDGQEHWNEDYAREYVRLSLLGVQDMNKMTECSKVLPKAVKSFRAKDQGVFDKWLNSPYDAKKDKEICSAVAEGDDVPAKESDIKTDAKQPITIETIENTSDSELAKSEGEFVKPT